MNWFTIQMRPNGAMMLEGDEKLAKAFIDANHSGYRGKVYINHEQYK